MYPLDSAEEIISHFNKFHWWSRGEKPDDDRVRSEYGDGLLSIYSVPWGTDAGRRQMEGSKRQGGWGSSR